MKVIKTIFDDCLVVEPTQRNDERCDMALLYSHEGEMKEIFHGFTLTEQRFYRMRKHAFFGIHKGPPRLVCIIAGKGLDYVVDLRKDSPTYKQYQTIELSGDAPKIVFIPSGFGHAFLSLAEGTIEAFGMDLGAPFEKSGPVNYKSPGIELKLPVSDVILADYDRDAAMLE